jgi:WD40 repeat protein
MVAICALLLAAGQPDAGRVVRVPVVFARPGDRTASKGVAGTLELRDFPPGPAGLFPDPRGMRNRRADAAFAAGLGHAWQFAADGSRHGRCVLWHLSLDGGVPDYAIDGGSLGAAFAVALRELLRRPRGSRPGPLGVARAFFVGLRPKCAITGTLAVQQPPAYDQETPRTADGLRLDLVGDMDAKLDAAQAKGLRLVAPAANRATAHPPANVHVYWAETIHQADRYARRVRPLRTAVSAIAILAVAGTSAGVLVTVQARSAEGTADAQAARQHTAALSGTLAADALANISTNLDIAELLAAEAYRLDPDPQTSAALFAVVTADPHLVRYLPATASVTALASSADGQTAVAGVADGEVLRWDLTDFQRSVVARLPAAIASVGVSQDGTTIAAADSTSALVWVEGKDTRQIPVPPGQEISAVAVSPAGQYAAFSLSGTGPNARDYVVLDDVWTGKSVTAQIHWPIASFPAPVSSLDFNGETQLMVLGNIASWERLAIPSLTAVSASGILAGADDRAQAMSATGKFISWTDGGSPLQVWTTSHAPSGAPTLGAGEVGVNPNALAISTDGQAAAEADDGTIYVSGITSYGNASSSTVLPLNGNTAINELTFAGSGHSELLSASGSFITLWNLDQYSRIAQSVSADIPATCVACPGPGIYPSPDGDQAIITGSLSGTAALISLPRSGRSAQVTLPGQENIRYGPALWAPDGKEFSILTPSDGAGEVWSATNQLEYTSSWPSQPSLSYTGSNAAAVLLRAPGDTKIIEIGTAGNVIIRNPETGAVERQVAGPVIPYPLGFGSWSQVAADASAKYAAVLVQTGSSATIVVDVINTSTGAVTRLPGGSASGVAYDGELLVVQRTSGTLEVWSDDGQHLIRSFAGDVNATAGPVVSPAGLAVEVNSDGSAPVYDVSSGQQVGSIVLPVSGFLKGTSVAFTPDGQDLISATEGSGQVTEWSFSPSSWSTVACTSAGHSLTSQEWQQYVGGALGLPTRMACTDSLASATAPSPGAVQAPTPPMTSASASPRTSPSASRCLLRQERCG